MTATIELTGEVVRAGDSGYEAAPADSGRENQISRAAEPGIGVSVIARAAGYLRCC